MPIQQIAPEMERIVSLDQEVEALGAGYQVGEGPLWWSEDRRLLFSEVRGSRHVRSPPPLEERSPGSGTAGPCTAGNRRSSR